MTVGSLVFFGSAARRCAVEPKKNQGNEQMFLHENPDLFHFFSDFSMQRLAWHLFELVGGKEKAPRVATRATARKLTPQQGVELNLEHGQREWDLYVTLSVDFCEYVIYRSYCGHR